MVIKMTKKIKNLIIIILTTLTIIISINAISCKSYGATGAATGGTGKKGGTGAFGEVIRDTGDEVVDNPTFNPKDYDPKDYDQAKNADKLSSIGNDIIGFLQIMGAIISVAVLSVLGIKYMFGSVEEKAAYKKTMAPYLVGAIMVFAITSIVGFIAPIAKDLF